MAKTSNSPRKNTRQIGRVLFLLMLAIIVGFFAALLILRPNSNHRGGSVAPASQH